MSVLLVSGTMLMMAAPAFAAEGDAIGTDTHKNGVTKLEITDYTVDPDTQLPSDPGAFTLVSVPDINFGQHSLDSIEDTNHVFTGEYENDLVVTDTRPTAASKTAALDQITSAEAGDAEQADVDAARTKWTNAVAASSWKINAKAETLNPTTDNIGTSLTIGGTEVMTAEGTILTEDATAPVGTKSYLEDLKTKTPELTVATNQLSVQTYEGVISYTAVSAE